MAMLFLGVAASSAFVEQRDVRLAPGQSVEVGGGHGHLRGPRRGCWPTARAPARPITFGAVLDVRRGDERFTLQPVAQLLRGAARAADGRLRALLQR